MPIRISRAAAANVKFSTPQEIVISHTDDSIRLGDGTSLITATTIGPDVGLDVNVINDLNLSVSHVDDSIKIGDGTDFLEVNSDGSINVVANAGTTPTIYNVSVPTANTEVSQALPANTKKFTLRNRTNAECKVAFVATESGTNYVTIKRGAVLSEDNLNLAAITLYFQCTAAGQTVEILAWS